MKKFLCLLMAVMMLTLAFTGCGNNEPEVQDSDNSAVSVKDSDWEYIKDKGVLTIGVTNYPPMNYLDDNGEWTGFDTDFAKAVGEELGIDVEFVEISWSAKETELASKNIDCLWNGMCITDERKEMWNVTDPYMNNTQAMVMKKDREAEILADISGKNVVAEAGSTGEEKITGVIDDSEDETAIVKAVDFFKDAKYTGVESMATALMDVENGVADVAVVDYVIALGMIGEDSSFADLVINTDNKFGDQFFGIAFRKDSDVRDMVNDAIEKLTENGTLKTIAEKYGIADSLLNK